jgi:hypothetical protein
MESLYLLHRKSENVPWMEHEGHSLRVLAPLFRKMYLKHGEKSFSSFELGPLIQYESGNVLDLKKNQFTDKTETRWRILLGTFGYYHSDNESRLRLFYLFKQESLRDGKKTFFSLELLPLFRYNSGNKEYFDKWDRLSSLSIDRQESLSHETHWDVLFGLIGYHRDGRETYIRLLWIFRL